MKPEMILKICVDTGMTIALLLLMTYELIGQAAHEWLGIGTFLCQKSAYDFRLLGICVDVSSSWTPLEHDDGNGWKSLSGYQGCPHMDAPDFCRGGCGLRSLCFCKTRYCKLYVSENSVCVF